MRANEYQKKCLSYTSNVSKASDHNLLVEGVMGLCGESGEAIEIVKKAFFQGHEFDDKTKYDLALELGDILWYAAIASWAIGYDLETVMAMNLTKLTTRYGEEFSVEKSRNRKENET